MNRRDFIALVGGAAAWPLGVPAQQPSMPVIGFLLGGSRDSYAQHIAAFHRGLAEAGYVEGQNVAVQYRWAEGQLSRLPALASDLVNRQVAVLVTSGSLAAATAKSATTTNSDRVQCERSGSAGSSQQPQPSGRQCYWGGRGRLDELWR